MRESDAAARGADFEQRVNLIFALILFGVGILTGVAIMGSLRSSAPSPGPHDASGGGPWVIVRHFSPRANAEIEVTQCFDRTHLIRALKNGDHVYRGCAPTKTGEYGWSVDVLSPEIKRGFAVEPRHGKLLFNRFSHA